MGSIHEETLLSANAAVANSSWHLVGNMETFVLTVSGIVAGDILQLWGSNDNGSTSPITNEEQIGDDITEDGIYQIAAGGIPKWVRLKRTDISGAGSVTAKFIARQ